MTSGASTRWSRRSANARIPATNVRKAPVIRGPFSGVGGSPCSGAPWAVRAFGCQVHRPHGPTFSSVDQGRDWSRLSATRPSLFGSGERAEAVRKPARAHTETPCSQLPLVSRATSDLSREILEEVSLESLEKLSKDAVEPGRLLQTGEMGGVQDGHDLALAPEVGQIDGGLLLVG